MNTTTKALALAVSGAFALSIAATTANAASNPFTAKSLSSGYMIAEADTKMKDGKCSTGKCGANKHKHQDEMKAAEGKCSAEMKAAEGKCSAEKKAAEGKCSAEKKAAEGKCSANK